MVSEVEEQIGWSDVLARLLAGRDLGRLEAEWAMEQVMAGSASPAQIAGFLVALRAKQVAAEEVATFVDTMLRHAEPFGGGADAVDTCGTGGDAAGTVNISTMSAIVVAATGQPVVKHGNRAASSKSGSADVLAELGIPLDLPPGALEDCLRQAGITFCFAPVFHPAMKHAGPVRRELGIPTVFNLLGPLANPARPAAQLVGVADPSLAPVAAQALALRGTSALVVRGDDGLDEITTMSTTTVWDATAGSVTEATFDAADIGIARPQPGALAGGDAAFNATVVEAVLADAPSAGEVVEAVCLNAGAALVAARAVEGGTLAERIDAGYRRAREAVATGAAQERLALWRDVTASLR